MSCREWQADIDLATDSLGESEENSARQCPHKLPKPPIMTASKPKMRSRGP